MWSLPDTLRMRISPTSAPISYVTFAMKSAYGDQENVKITPTMLDDAETVIDVAMTDWCDPTDIGVYPITVEYIYFGMGTSTTGTEYTIDMVGFEGIYDAVDEESGIASTLAGGSGFGVKNTLVGQGEPLTLSFDKEGTANVVVYNAAGQKAAAASVYATAGETAVGGISLAPGVYFVGITQNGQNTVTKIIVK